MEQQRLCGALTLMIMRSCAQVTHVSLNNRLIGPPREVIERAIFDFAMRTQL